MTSHGHSHGDSHGHSHGHGHHGGEESKHHHEAPSGVDSGHGHAGKAPWDQPGFGAMYGKMTRLTQLGYDDLFQLAAGAIGVPTATNVLVAGCGGGQELVTFAAVPTKDKRTIVGVDPSGPFLDFAKQRVESEVKDKSSGITVKYVNGLVSDLPEPGASGFEAFDAATLMYVLHHCPDDDSKGGKAAVLRSIAVRLKPGAKFFLVDSSRCTDDAIFKRQIEAGAAYQQIRGVPAESTAKMVKALPTLPLITEERTLELLKSLGFVDVLKLYSAFHVSGWVATYQPKKA